MSVVRRRRLSRWWLSGRLLLLSSTASVSSSSFSSLPQEPPLWLFSALRYLVDNSACSNCCVKDMKDPRRPPGGACTASVCSGNALLGDLGVSRSVEWIFLSVLPYPMFFLSVPCTVVDRFPIILVPSWIMMSLKRLQQISTCEVQTCWYMWCVWIDEATLDWELMPSSTIICT